jgi:hypothetical protein
VISRISAESALIDTVRAPRTLASLLLPRLMPPGGLPGVSGSHPEQR